MSSAVLTKSLSKSIFVGAVHTNCTLVHGWEYLFVIIIIIIIIITIIIEVFVDESIYLVFGTYRLLYYSETVL
jgi:aminoglycoside N3'-acetyltransferase